MYNAIHTMYTSMYRWCVIISFQFIQAFFYQEDFLCQLGDQINIHIPALKTLCGCICFSGYIIHISKQNCKNIRLIYDEALILTFYSDTEYTKIW